MGSWAISMPSLLTARRTKKQYSAESKFFFKFFCPRCSTFLFRDAKGLKKLAKSGSRFAMGFLGLLHLNGEYGVTQDNALARKWCIFSLFVLASLCILLALKPFSRHCFHLTRALTNLVGFLAFPVLLVLPASTTLTGSVGQADCVSLCEARFWTN